MNVINTYFGRGSEVKLGAFKGYFGSADEDWQDAYCTLLIENFENRGILDSTQVKDAVTAYKEVLQE